MAKEPREEREGRTNGRGPQRIGIRRLLGWAAFLPLASRAPIYARLFLELVRDDRTPAGRKALLAGALGYLVVGRDLVPDDLPIIGGLDDLVVVVLAVDLFLDGVPDDLLDEKLDELGIDRRGVRRDVARIRRFTPGSAPPASSGAAPAARRVRGRYARAQRGSDRGSGPGSTRRNPSREGHPDQGRRQARQERRDEARSPTATPPTSSSRSKLAVPAVRRCLSRVPARHREPRGQAQARARGSRDRRDPHRSTTLTMGVKVGEGGKLYGSINNQDIAEALGRRGITVDRHKIDLEQPIKSLGTYKVAIKVFSGMTPEVTIVVEPKG